MAFNEKKSKVSVEIMGETYALKGNSDVEHIKEVAAFLNERMKKIAQSNPRLSPEKLAVLAALNMADEYLRLEQDYQQLLQLLKDNKNQYK